MEVLHNKDENCFEVETDGLSSRVYYEIDGDNMSFVSTHVPPALEGKGIASFITKYALDYAIKHNYRIVPVCPFTEVYIKRHPEYQEYL